jgi:RNA polymerase sigma factor (sigma-70 family)
MGAGDGTERDSSGDALPPRSPETVLCILRSACTQSPDPRLDGVLAQFRERWLVLGRRRYGWLGGGIEDAAQIALMRLVASDKLDSLRQPTALEAWARSFFVHAVLDLARDGARRDRMRVSAGASGGHTEDELLDGIPDGRPTPEELASFRERLAIVGRVVARLEVARLKFVDDLPEKEIATRRGMTRSCVAGRLKRVRQALRQALGDDG